MGAAPDVVGINRLIQMKTRIKMPRRRSSLPYLILSWAIYNIKLIFKKRTKNTQLQESFAGLEKEKDSKRNQKKRKTRKKGGRGGRASTVKIK